MTRTAPAFQLYAEDFFCGVVDMTDAEVGIYIKLLAVCWAKNGITESMLWSISQDVDAAKAILRAKFTQDSAGRWNHKRLVEQRVLHEKRKRAGSKGGSKGGSKSQAKGQAKGQAKAKQNGQQKAPPPSPSPSPSSSPLPTPNSEEENNAAKSPRVSYPAAFEEFWEAYPANSSGRKRGKRKAYGIWLKIPAADRDSLMIAVGHYANEETKFIRDPERFLGSYWWRDWIEQPQKGSSQWI